MPLQLNKFGRAVHRFRRACMEMMAWSLSKEERAQASFPNSTQSYLFDAFPKEDQGSKCAPRLLNVWFGLPCVSASASNKFLL